MRLVSLLPSLTELVWALGRGADLVGVTHECDFPPEVSRLPSLTASRISDSATSAEIDALVAAQRGDLYELDAERLATLGPDLILTQEQCDVCAVNEQTVRRVAAGLPGSPPVLSVNPRDLAGVFAMFRSVGDALDARQAAEALIARFEQTTDLIARRRQGLDPVPGVHLEWLDPLFASGHWNPEIIARAGGRELVGRPGTNSFRFMMEELEAAKPEWILAAPCGFAIDRTRQELQSGWTDAGLLSISAAQAGRLALVDGSAYFSRPGPRLETSLRIAAAVIDPDRCGDLAPADSWESFRL